jgi:hypothetical protein
MIRQRLKTVDHKAQQPFESDLGCTAYAAKGEAFQQQTLHEITGFIRDQMLLKTIDKLTATVLALMILFAVVNVTVLLIFGGFATWTDISDDHTHGKLPVLSQRFESTITRNRVASITWSALPRSGDPVEQEKRIKYRDLVANAVMLHNVVDMTNALYDLQQSGVCITPELAARLSPYLTEHIKRFGKYSVNP